MLKSLGKILLLAGIAFFAYSYFLYQEPTQRTEPVILPLEYTPATGTRNPIIRLGSIKYTFFCSGVVISNEYALTAAHCVVDDAGKLDPETIYISDVDGNFINDSASAVAIEKLRDIALIKGDFSEFASYEVDWEGKHFNTLQRDRSAMACGFPSGEALFCPYIFYQGNFFFQMAFSGGPIYKGQSGGPVFVMNNGVYYVIGVNSGVNFNSIIIAPAIGARSLLWGF